MNEFQAQVFFYLKRLSKYTLFLVIIMLFETKHINEKTHKWKIYKQSYAAFIIIIFYLFISLELGRCISKQSRNARGCPSLQWPEAKRNWISNDRLGYHGTYTYTSKGKALVISSINTW